MAYADDLPYFKHNHKYRGINYTNVVLDSSIDRLKILEVRPDDIWIVTFPKAGTHWMMEIIGLILSNGDPGKVNRSLYSSCVEMINMNQPFPPTKKEELHPMDWTPFLDIIERAPSPRAMLIHLQYDLLPQDLLKAKMADADDIPSIMYEHEHRGIKYPNIVLDSSIDRLKTFEVRPDDIWIVTFPKAGTHWMMEIVGLILSNGDPDKVNRSLYSSTVEMINMDQPFPATRKEEELHPMDRTPFLDTIEKAPSPRAMLTHLQHDLLPQDLLKAKVVYLARNPKDIIVSWYCFVGKDPALPLTVEKAINDLVTGEMQWGPWPEHVRPFWDLRNHENLTFVFYEDLKKDPSTHIKRIAEGIGHPISEEVLEQVVKFSHIDAQKETFKKMEESGKGNLVKASGEFSFLNTGISGRWKNFFTVAQNEAFDKWYDSKMAATDIKFSFE